MGWGCYKHEWDHGSEDCQKKLDELIEAKLKETPRTWGRDGEICPACWEEYERIVKAAVALLSTLGSDDGYFPGAGVTKTRELKNAVKAAGLEVPWGATA